MPATATETSTQERPPTRRRRSGHLLIILGALVLGGALTVGLFGQGLGRAVINGLFGPPSVAMVEAHQDTGTVTFDHSDFDAMLRAYVSPDGLIDYPAFKGDPRLEAYITRIGQAKLDQMSRDEKLTLLINAYNAFTIRLINDNWQNGSLKSIKDIDKPWDGVRWNIAGTTYSLNQVEHEQIRPKFKEPRIHFALVCAAIGCPPLRNEAFQASRLEEQLESQTRYVHGHPRWFSYDAATNRVALTKLYDWYGGDFVQSAGSVLAYVGQYSPELKKTLDAGRKPKVSYLEYDWGLNRKR